MKNNKKEILTFKVDEDLYQAIKDIPNRSEFIRSAVMAALESTCPLCKGTGYLSPHQKMHWEEFEDDHSWEECKDCHELRLVCSNVK